MVVYVSGQDSEVETTTPVVAILKQINEVNDDGSYTFGYEAADGTFKVETRDIDGNVKGKYGYLDDNGVLKTVEYNAGKTEGFTAQGDHLPEPVAPLPVAPVAQAAPVAPVPAPQSFNRFAAPQAVPQQVAPQQFAPQQFPTQQFAPQQFPTQQFAPQQFAPQQFAPQQFVPQQAPPQQFAPQQFPPQQFTPQQFVPQQAPQDFNQRGVPQFVPQINNPNFAGVRAPPAPVPQNFNRFSPPQQFQGAPQVPLNNINNNIDNDRQGKGFSFSFNAPTSFPQQQLQPQAFNSFPQRNQFFPQ